MHRRITKKDEFFVVFNKQPPAHVKILRLKDIADVPQPSHALTQDESKILLDDLQKCIKQPNEESDSHSTPSLNEVELNCINLATLVLNHYPSQWHTFPTSGDQQPIVNNLRREHDKQFPSSSSAHKAAARKAYSEEPPLTAPTTRRSAPLTSAVKPTTRVDVERMVETALKKKEASTTKKRKRDVSSADDQAARPPKSSCQCNTCPDATCRCHCYSRGRLDTIEDSLRLAAAMKNDGLRDAYALKNMEHPSTGNVPQFGPGMADVVFKKHQDVNPVHDATIFSQH